MVGGGMPVGRGNGIVVLHTKQAGGRKAGTKLNTPHGRYGKNGMADLRFYRIPKRLAQANGQVGGSALHNTTHRIFFIDGFLQPMLNIGFAAYFGNGGGNSYAILRRSGQNALGHYAHRHQANG